MFAGRILVSLATACTEIKFRPGNDAVNRRENEHRGWFCRRNVVLVSAGFRAWRFVRARSARRASLAPKIRSGYGSQLLISK